MNNKFTPVFQTDSSLVNKSYRTRDNYLIELDALSPKDKWCAIYFSSNDIYYPNNEATFKNEIEVKNKFEWFGTRIKKASKHIFLRDIKKQWYLTGINSDINSPIKLVDFLKEETKDYKIITIGSSAGGFAAVIIGQLLGAQHIFSFNGQFEISSLLENSNESTNPVVFRNKNNANYNKFYSTLNFITKPSTIIYFTSLYSGIDKKQKEFIHHLPIQIFGFKTAHHGIPFIKSTLPSLINMDVHVLLDKKRTKINPILFSINIGGFGTTLKGIVKSFKKKYLTS